jgi:hypothetical protein
MMIVIGEVLWSSPAGWLFLKTMSEGEGSISIDELLPSGF